MKKLIICMLASIFSLGAFADGERVVEGSLAPLKSANLISVRLDYQRLVFRNVLGFSDLVGLLNPKEDWENQCMKEFLEHFNEETDGRCCFALWPDTDNRAKYEMILTISQVSKDGEIFGYATIYDKENSHKVAVIRYRSEGDDDDDYLFKDALEELGESMGRFIRRQLRKVRNY